MADRRTTFIQTYMPYAQEASAMTGIDPSVILAQAAHETGWGRKAPGNNFFGIKGGGQTFATHEYIGGKRVNMKAGFRRYDDPRGSFLDWAKLMQTPRYAKVLAAQTPEEQIKALKAAGYATDPAYVSKLNSVRSQVAEVAGEVAPAGAGGIMDVAALNTAPSSVPDAPTAAQGFAPDLGGVRDTPAQAAISDMLSAPPTQPPQWAGNTSFPPRPLEPYRAFEIAAGWMPQFAQPYAMPTPIDEALTGQNAQDVLTGGPRMDPRRAPPGTGPIPADMGMMRSPADVLAAGPRIRPGGAPDASMVPDPTISPMRPAMGGPNDRRPQPPMPPPRAQGIPDPRIRPDPASLPQRGFPTAFGEQPPALMGGMSAAMGGPPSRVGDLSAAMGNAPPPDFTPASQPISTDPSFGVGYRVQRDANRMAAEQDARMADFAGGMESDRIAAELEMRRREMEPFTPAYRAPETATMGDRFNAASPFPNAEQMFGLPAMNAPASFPGPDPRIGTAEAGSTTGEFFTPAPPMPQPLPDPMAGRFNDAFSPAGPGMIADLQGAFNRQQASAPPNMTAQDGINSVFGAPPAAATPPNLAIPFAEVPGFGVPPAAASTVPTPPMGLGTFNDRFSPPMPSMAPQPISMGEFNDRFAGGSVVNTPQPGQPGVVQGTMPTPAGAMDIRPPAQGGPPLPPQATPQAAPASPPRQTNPATERQRSGIVGRVLGGLLGGPIGALGGGLLGGGGGGFGFGTASFNPMGGGGSAPYGNGGTTTYQKGTSNALGGSNALSWKSSNGGTVTATQDPWTGTYYTSYGP